MSKLGLFGLCHAVRVGYPMSDLTSSLQEVVLTYSDTTLSGKVGFPEIEAMTVEASKILKASVDPKAELAAGEKVYKFLEELAAKKRYKLDPEMPLLETVADPIFDTPPESDGEQEDKPEGQEVKKDEPARGGGTPAVTEQEAAPVRQSVTDRNVTDIVPGMTAARLAEIITAAQAAFGKYGIGKGKEQAAIKAALQAAFFRPMGVAKLGLGVTNDEFVNFTKDIISSLNKEQYDALAAVSPLCQKYQAPWPMCAGKLEAAQKSIMEKMPDQEKRSAVFKSRITELRF